MGGVCKGLCMCFRSADHISDVSTHIIHVLSLNMPLACRDLEKSMHIYRGCVHNQHSEELDPELHTMVKWFL